MKRDKIGIIRKVDEMGRVVIPKEIRNQLDIEIGTNIEISMVKIQNDKNSKEYVVELRKAENND